MPASASSSRKSLNNPDSFCYKCGSFTINSQKTNISTFVRQAYFKVKIGDQDKPCHKLCKQRVKSLQMWTKKTRDKFPFGIPMNWREPRDHSSDCYSCIVKTLGYNKKNRRKIGYPNLPSAIRPVPHSAEIPVPVFKVLPSLEVKEYESGEGRSDPNDDDFEI
ncbi:hypothetical protein AVEN_220665-1 [Araneus ventricosus]|uniref:Uncharacterized protein n=1 Tax=Araneus ventricosus TaxID=182803 RepID=A0A4Y2Q9V0_ARAVE|nr:hypothetical protein AVEN_220665-1 [Araneus ventricosus]